MSISITVDPALADWLLDADPALRWQVERDLLGAPEADWAATRSRVATEGFGARLLLTEQVAVLLLPALAATPSGDRLGQGGGYYDRLLSELPGVASGGPLRVCLVGDDELRDVLPTDAHDEPVDIVVTA